MFQMLVCIFLSFFIMLLNFMLAVCMFVYSYVHEKRKAMFILVFLALGYKLSYELVSEFISV
jgi:hypothetical protein